jgi:hypothetical protein
VIDVLGWAGISWALAPSDWVGVHHLLTASPASLAIGIVGIAAAWIWYRVRTRIPRSFI